MGALCFYSRNFLDRAVFCCRNLSWHASQVLDPSQSVGALGAGGAERRRCCCAAVTDRHMQAERRGERGEERCLKSAKEPGQGLI